MKFFCYPVEVRSVNHDFLINLQKLVNLFTYYFQDFFLKIFINRIGNNFGVVKTPKPSMQSSKVTERIHAKTFELLEKHPEGLRWSELLSNLKASDPTFHPKTVNGCIWKLVEKFPNRIYKPSKGIFRLLKYK